MAEKFVKQFKAAHAVSTPLVTIRTFDAKSTVEHVKANINENISVIVWDCIKGMEARKKEDNAKLKKAIENAGSSIELTMQLQEALRVAGHLVDDKGNGDTILMLSNAHLFWSEAPVIQGIWNLRDSFKAWGNMLVLLTGNGAILPPELTNDFLVLDEPLPTKDDLATIIKDTFEYAKLKKPSDDIINNATKALIGLPAFTAEQSTAMCLDTVAKKLDVDGLWDRKRQAINQTRGLSVLQTDARLDDIGGLEQFKEYLERLMNGEDPPNVILLWDEIEKHFAGMGTDTSGTTTKMGGNVLTWSNDVAMRGAIGVGVPGAGKTQIVKAIANKYDRLCISFNLADMESGLVGSSNEYLRNAQAVIDSISDKKILSIATCNKIESLSPELKRRFANEGVFFFDAPNTVERESIWKIYRKKYKIPDTDSTPDDNGWTGAEIENCARKAYRFHISLNESAKYIVPVTKSDAITIDNLRRSCSGKFLSASYPGTYVYNEHEEPMQIELHSGRKMR